MHATYTHTHTHCHRGSIHHFVSDTMYKIRRNKNNQTVKKLGGISLMKIELLHDDFLKKIENCFLYKKKAQKLVSSYLHKNQNSHYLCGCVYSRKKLLVTFFLAHLLKNRFFFLNFFF